jgi:hypothetical protein
MEWSRWADSRPGPPNAELARYPSIAKLRAELREAGFVG